MVATIGGAGLGLFNTSAALLGTGGNAAQGKRNEQVYVNAANGNLVIQATDEQLASVGLDLSLVRTYNSQGTFDGDNNDGWRMGVYQSIALTGTRGSANSFVTKTLGDGAQSVYRWDTARNAYVSTDGDGAHDTLTYDSGTRRWTWREGSTDLTETYDLSGRFVASSDALGNVTSYSYNFAGRLIMVADSSGQTTYLDYAGANLTRVRVRSGNQTQTLTRYAYDSSNRLRQVTLDLSPSDNDVSTGPSYVTNYTYLGNTKQVETITQTDGSAVRFDYFSNSTRVRQVTVTTASGVSRVTQYAFSGTFSAASGTYAQCDITDALGQVTTYRFDNAGRLTQVLSPTVGGTRPQTAYGYDAQGNLEALTDGQGRTTTYTYTPDGKGNLLSTRDALGNTVSRTYTLNNRVLTETSQPAAGASSVTRYVYDGNNGGVALRFKISPDGRVTEYRYNPEWQVASEIAYTGSFYAAGGAAPSEADMVAWVNAAAQDKTKTQRTDYTYDFRGALSSTTAWASTDNTGAGSGTPSVTRYVYDQRGYLLSTIEARGEATADATDYITSHTYDGLGRTLSSTQWLAAGQIRQTLYSYTDSATSNTLVTRFSNGLTTTSTYNLAGELTSVANNGSVSGDLGVTAYHYDSRGQLRSVTDPTGVRQYLLYDEAGRKKADVDSDGTLTEYSYDGSGLLVKTVRYATKVPPGTLNTLSNAAGTPSTANQTTLLNTLRDIASANAAADQITRDVYDGAGRVVFSLSETGSVIEMKYDGAGRLTDTIAYARPVAIARTVDVLLPTGVTVTSDADDRHVRHYYNADGQLTGELDAEGYLTENLYDAAGRLTKTIAYAGVASAAQRASSTLLTPRPAYDNLSADPPEAGATSYFFYDGQGRLVGQLDAEGYLSETAYDLAGRPTRAVRYDFRLSYVEGSSNFQSLRAAASVGATKGTSFDLYDGAGRLLRSTRVEDNTVTTYEYDGADNLTRSTTALGVAADERSTRAEYDELGRVRRSLSAEGCAELATAVGASAIEAVWTRYGTTFTYDAAGRMVLQTQSAYDKTNGQVAATRTAFYYDADGRVCFMVDALGNVIETSYNALGQTASTLTYFNRINPADLNGGLLTDTLTRQLTAGTSPSRLRPVVDAVHDGRIDYTYTQTGQVLTRTTAVGAQAAYEYNAFGEMSAHVERIGLVGDNRSRRNEYTYDHRGLLKGAVVDTTGVRASSGVSYDAFGRQKTVTDALLQTGFAEYDRLGRSISTINAAGTRVSRSYDAFDRVLTTTDGLSNVTRYEYAYVNGSLVMTVTTPEGVAVSTTYNSHGQELMVVAAGGTTTFGYDRNGQLESTSDTFGTLESRAYDSAGRLVTSADGRATVTRFSYDAANQLLTRTVDSAAGGLALQTVYAYDGQGRTLQVTEPEGRITRQDHDADGRVISITVDPVTTANPGGLNLRTEFGYDLESHTLTRTEGVGSSWQRVTLSTYDSLGRLITQTEDLGRLDLVTQFKYDQASNMRRSIDANGNSAWYFYDAIDRLTLTVDAQGGATGVTYDANGQKQSVRGYSTRIDVAGWGDAPTRPAPSISSTDVLTQTVYDRDGRVAFIVSGNGGVTEFTYDGPVMRTRVYALRVVSGTYESVAAVQDMLAAAGNNINVIGAQDLVSWTVSDERGRDEFVIDGTGGVTQHVYDGAGNLVSSTAFARRRSTGLTVDRAGLRSFATDNASNFGNLIVKLGYDRADRLVVSTQAGTTVIGAVVRSFTLYDALGRVVGSIDGDGSLTEYVYDSMDRVVKQVRYAVYVPQATLTSMVDASGIPTNVSLATVKASIGRMGGARLADRVTRNVYDSAGLLVYTIDEAGGVAKRDYDTAGRLLTTRMYAGALTTPIAPNVNILQVSDVVVSLDEANDRVARYFYDKNGNRTGILEAEGYLVETIYDSLNQAVAIVAYANVTAAGLRATGSLDQLRPTADTDASDGDTERDARSYFFIDGLGRQIGNLDADGYFSEAVYDTAGNIVRSIRYDRVLSYPAGSNPFQSLKSAANGAPTQVMRHEYDGVGRAFQQIDPLGSIGTSSYDNAGRVVSVTMASGSAEARTTQTRYDAQGRVAQTLSGEGSKALAAGADLEATWNRYGIRYTYDAGGRLATETAQVYDPVSGAQNVSTAYVYDADGRVRFTVNGLGEVVERNYDVYGQLTESRSYSGRIAAGSRTGGLVNSSLAASLTPIADAISDSWTSYAYTQAGQVDTVQTAGGTTTVSHYNAFGQVWERIERVDDIRTRRSEFAYDRRGLLLDAWVDTANLNLHSGSTYDAFGRVRTITDPRGVVTRIDHGVDTNAGSATLGRTTLIATDALGGKQITSYDAFGRVMRVLDPAGAKRVTGGMTAAQIESVWAQYSTKYHYDDISRAMTVTTPEGIQVRTVKDAHGQAMSVTAAGNTTTYAYDADGQLTSVSDLQGNTAADRILEARTYDSAGRLVTSTDGKGTVTRLAYDAANRVLTRTVDYAGASPLITRYEYDGQSQLVLVTGPDGQVTRTDYDHSGRVTLVAVDPRTLPNGQVRAGALNLLTAYSYDLEGRVVSVTERAETASASTTVYRYDTQGLRTDAIVDPTGLNLHTQYRYDANANLTHVIDPGGYDTWYAYDAKNQGVYSVDELGQVAKTTYDSDGRVIGTRRYVTPVDTSTYQDEVTVATLDGAVTPNASLDQYDQTIYDRDGRAQLYVDAMGGVTEHSFDAAGRISRSRTYGQAVDWAAIGTYDEDSLRVALTRVGNVGVDPLSPVQYGAKDVLSWQAYDLRGRLAYAQDGTGGVTGYTYDGAGNVIGQTVYAARRPITADTSFAAIDGSVNKGDAANRTTRFWYDGANRSRFTLDGEGYLRETRYSDSLRETRSIVYATARTSLLGANSNLADVGAAAGNLDSTRDQVVISRTDAAGRLSAMVDGAGNSTAYTYDLTANTRSIRDANGGVTLETFDMAGRLASRRSPGNVLLSNVYDNLSNLLSATQSWEAGTAQAAAAGGLDARTTKYEYDRLGRVTVVTDGEDFSTRIEYDAFGNQKRVTTGLYLVPNTAAKFSSAKAARALKSMDSQFAFNANNQVTDFTDGEGNVTHHNYDAAGRRVSTIEAFTGANNTASRTSTYDYDAAGRLVRVINPLNGITRYTYTAGGETETEQVLQSATVDLNAAGPQTGRILLDSAGTPSNAVWINKTYEYYKNGRLKAEIVPYGSGTTASTTRNETYYDAAGNVIEQRSAAGTADQRSVQMRYDLANRNIARLDGVASAALTATNVETIWATRATQYKYDGVGNLIKLTQPANVWGQVGVVRYYYNADSQLTTVLDGEGFINTFGYDAAGNQSHTTVYIKPLTDAAFTAIGDTSLEPAPVATAGEDRSTLQHFDRANKLDMLTMPDETRVEYTNDGSGKKLMERRYYPGISTPRVMSYSYDGNGRLLQFMDVDGLYNPANGSYSGGTVTLYTYDGVGNQLSLNLVGTLTSGDRNTQRPTTFEYDLNNRRIKETFDPTGINLVKDTRYDAAGNVTLQFNNATTTTGAPTLVYAYDLNNQLVREDKPAQAFSGVFGGPSMSTSYGYDRVGNRTSATNGRNARTTYVYDRSNRLVVEMLPEVTVYAFSATDPNTTQARPTVTHTYDWTGQEYQTTDANGNRTTTWRDRNGRVARHLSAVGGLTTYTYNGAGEVTQKVEYEAQFAASTHNNTTTMLGLPTGPSRLTGYQYDTAGRLTVKTLPAVDVVDITAPTTDANVANTPTLNRANGVLLTERHVYNAYGDEVESYDRAGNRTLRYYDVRHREVLIIDPEGYATGRQYDTVGNVMAQMVFTEPLSAAALTALSTVAPPPAAALGAADITSWEYDTASRVLKQIDPVTDFDVLFGSTYQSQTLRRETVFTYDASGNMRSKTIGYGTAAAQTELVEYYYYDGAGRRVAMIDKNRVITYYGYDTAGNRTREWKLAGQVSSSVTFTAANLPNLVGDSINGWDRDQDQVTDYVYDMANRMTTEVSRMVFRPITGNGSFDEANTGDDLTRHSDYDRTGNRTRTIDEDGYVTRIDYNAAGQVKQTISADLVGSVMEYDVFGNLTGMYSGIAPYGVSADGNPVAAASPATITGAAINVGVVSVSYTAALGNTSSWVVYDTVSHAGVEGYANRSATVAVRTGETRASLPDAGGGNWYFRVVTQDDAGNIAWSAERSLSMPSRLTSARLVGHGNYREASLVATFDGAVSNVRVLYGAAPTPGAELAGTGVSQAVLSSSLALTLQTDGTDRYEALWSTDGGRYYYALQWTDSAGVVHTEPTQSLLGGTQQVDLTTDVIQTTMSGGYQTGARITVAAQQSTSTGSTVSFSSMRMSWRPVGSTQAATLGAADTGYFSDSNPADRNRYFDLNSGTTALAAGSYVVEIIGVTSDGRSLVVDSYTAVVGAGQPAWQTHQTSSWLAPTGLEQEAWAYFRLYSNYQAPDESVSTLSDAARVVTASDGRSVMRVPTLVTGDALRPFIRYGTRSLLASQVEISSSNPGGATTDLTFTLNLSPQDRGAVDAAWGTGPALTLIYRALLANGQPDPEGEWWYEATETSPGSGVYRAVVEGVTNGAYEFQSYYWADAFDSSEPWPVTDLVYLTAPETLIGEGWDRADSRQASVNREYRSFTVEHAVEGGLIYNVAATFDPSQAGTLNHGYQGRLVNGPDTTPLVPMSDRTLSVNDVSDSTSGTRTASGTSNDSRVEIRYDALNQKIAGNENSGLYTEYGLDRAGNVVETRLYGVPGNNEVITTYAAYDKRNRTVVEFGALTPVYLNGSPERRVTRQKYDAYDHVVSRWTQPTLGADTISGASARKDYKYNALGARIEEVDFGRVVAGDITRYRYNLLGFLTRMARPKGIGSTVANTTYSDIRYYDAWARTAFEVDALGNRTAYGYDLFDRVITKTDARGVVTAPTEQRWVADYTTWYSYDNRDRLKTELEAQIWSLWYSDDLIYQEERVALLGDANARLASGLDDDDRSWLARQYTVNYGYDGRNNLTVVEIAPATAYTDTVRTTYDAMGRVWKTVHTGRSVNGVATPIDGSERGYDAYGNLIREVDGMGRTRKTEYGAFGRRSRLIDEDGVAISYTYDDFGRVIREIGDQQPTPPGQAQVLPRALNYFYNDDGKLNYIQDVATGIYTEYEYDVRGNRRHEVVSINASVFGAYTGVLRDQVVSFQANDQMTGWRNSVGTLNEAIVYEDITYDANGNVGLVTGRGPTTTSPSGDDTTLSINHRYTYDAADRVVNMVQTDRLGAQENRNAILSWRYDMAGNLRGVNDDEYTTVDGTQSAVDAMNRLRMVVNGSTVQGIWRYDPLGREIFSEREISRYVHERTATTYNGSGPVPMLSTVVVERRDQLAEEPEDRDQFLWRSTNTDVHDTSGRVITRKSENWAPGRTITYDYTFDYFGDGREKTISATGGANPVASVTRYDSNKNLVYIDQDRSSDLSNHHERSWMTYDNENHVIYRASDQGIFALGETAISSLGGLYTEESRDFYHYFYADGAPVGEHSRTVALGTTTVLDSGRYLSVQTPRSVDGPNRYTVVAGDTLTSIAAQVYGNPSLWYVIADANGLTGSEALTAGRTLTLPSSVQVGRTTAESHVVYSQNKITGSTLPNVLGPPPPKPSILIQTLTGFVMAIIAILVTVLTWGIGTALGVAAGSAAALLIAGVVGVVGGVLIAGAKLAERYLQADHMGLDPDVSAADVRRALVGGAITGALGNIGSQWLSAGFGPKGIFEGAHQSFVPIAKAAIAVTNNYLGQWSHRDYDKKGTVINWAGVGGAAVTSLASNVPSDNLVFATVVPAATSALGQVAANKGEVTSWTDVALAGVGGFLSGLKTSAQADRTEALKGHAFDKMNFIDLDEVEALGDTVDLLGTLQQVMHFVTPWARLPEKALRNGGLTPSDWVQAVGNTVMAGVNFGVAQGAGEARAALAKAAEAGPAKAAETRPAVSASAQAFDEYLALGAAGVLKGQAALGPYGEHSLTAQAHVERVDGGVVDVEDSQGKVSKYKLSITTSPVDPEKAMADFDAKAARNGATQTLSPFSDWIDSVVQGAAQAGTDIKAGVARASGEVSSKANVDKWGLGDIYGQEAFGSTPIEVRVEPERSIQNSDFTHIGSEDEVAQLERSSAPAPKISLYFVDQIRTKETDYLSVVSPKQGLGRIDGNVSVVAADVAVFGNNSNQIAHELGHNLGLDHPDSGGSEYNLMNPTPQNQVMGQLTRAQAQQMLSSPLVQTDPVTGGRFIQVVPIAVKVSPGNKAPVPDMHGATRRFTKQYLTPWVKPLIDWSQDYYQTATSGSIRFDPLGPALIKYFGGTNRKEARDGLYKNDYRLSNLMDFTGRGLGLLTGVPMEANRQFVGSVVYGLMAYGKQLDIERTGVAVTGETSVAEVRANYLRDNIKYGIINFASYMAGHFLPKAGQLDPRTGLPKTVGAIPTLFAKWGTEWTVNVSMKVMAEQAVKTYNSLRTQIGQVTGRKWEEVKAFGFFGQNGNDALRAVLTGHEGLAVGYFLNEAALSESRILQEQAKKFGAVGVGVGLALGPAEFMLKSAAWGTSRFLTAGADAYLKDNPLLSEQHGADLMQILSFGPRALSSLLRGTSDLLADGAEALADSAYDSVSPGDFQPSYRTQRFREYQQHDDPFKLIGSLVDDGLTSMSESLHTGVFGYEDQNVSHEEDVERTAAMIWGLGLTAATGGFSPRPGIPGTLTLNAGPGRIRNRVAASAAAAKGAAPIWSATKSKSAVENAFGHWQKHGAEFPELANGKQYAETARSLVTSPPTGALTKARGAETLIYDQATNTFLVRGANGAPKTMFRPTDGIDYWNRQ